MSAAALSGAAVLSLSLFMLFQFARQAPAPSVTVTFPSPAARPLPQGGLRLPLLRQPPAARGTPVAEPAQAEASEDPLLETLPIEQKVGQLIMSGFVGTAASEALPLLESYHVGGLVLFERNIVTPEQVLAMTQELQAAALAHNAGIPSLVAIDQEGGKVVRLKGASGFSELPWAATLACIDDVGLTRATGTLAGTEMRAVGVTIDLAPVFDVNDNPANPVIGRRAFGSDPGTVARHAGAFAGGLRAAGVAATAKHFPGHGNTSLDSHHVLPTVDKPLSGLYAVEIAPFREAIEEGLVDAVMTAHVLYPALDRVLPATLSPAIVDGLLRDELGFDGVVLTDALSMGAITQGFDIGEAAVLAIEAGADVIALPHSSTVPLAYDALLEAVLQGRISEERLDKSVGRILALKRRLQEETPPDIAAVNSSEHRALLERVGQIAVDRGCEPGPG